jgi:GT2 family glycosyltransferase
MAFPTFTSEAPMPDVTEGADASLRAPSLTAVIINYRTPDLVLQCLSSLLPERSWFPQLRAIVVDGGSGDSSAVKLVDTVGRAEFKEWVTFLELPINGGFGWANNQAILGLAAGDSPPDFIYLLNPDAQVSKGALAALVRELQSYPRAGAAGSQLLTADGRPGGSAFRFPSAGREFISAAQSEKLGRVFGIAPVVINLEGNSSVDWVTGASVLFRSEALRETGLFDDGFFLYFDEVELLHRMRRRGWLVRHVPDSLVTHIEGASTGIGSASDPRPWPEYWYRSRRRYFGLTGGRKGLIAANLAWAVGRLASVPVTLIRRKRKGRTRASGVLLPLWPAHEEVTASFPRFGDAPGNPPAWMQQ